MSDVLHFTLELRSKEKERLIPVILELLDGNASANFEWEMEMKEHHNEYVLIIYNYSWVSNLLAIARSIPLCGLNDDGKEAEGKHSI